METLEQNTIKSMEKAHPELAKMAHRGDMIMVPFYEPLTKWNAMNGVTNKPVVFDDILCRDELVALFKSKLNELRDASHAQWEARQTICMTVPGTSGTGKTMMMSALATEALNHGIPTWNAVHSSQLDIRYFGERMPAGTPSIVVFEETSPEHNTGEWKYALEYIIQSIDLALSKSPDMRVLLIVVLTCETDKVGAFMS